MEGYVYKLVEWYDRLGEEHSNLVDIFEATVPDAVRAIEISSKVSNKIIVFETNDLFSFFFFKSLLFIWEHNVVLKDYCIYIAYHAHICVKPTITKPEIFISPDHQCHISVFDTKTFY